MLVVGFQNGVQLLKHVFFRGVMIRGGPIQILCIGIFLQDGYRRIWDEPKSDPVLNNFIKL